jgi:hypothetical protein
MARSSISRRLRSSIAIRQAVRHRNEAGKLTSGEGKKGRASERAYPNLKSRASKGSRSVATLAEVFDVDLLESNRVPLELVVH